MLTVFGPRNFWPFWIFRCFLKDRGQFFCSVCSRFESLDFPTQFSRSKMGMYCESANPFSQLGLFQSRPITRSTSCDVTRVTRRPERRIHVNYHVIRTIIHSSALVRVPVSRVLRSASLPDCEKVMVVPKTTRIDTAKIPYFLLSGIFAIPPIFRSKTLNHEHFGKFGRQSCIRQFFDCRKIQRNITDLNRVF